MFSVNLYIVPKSKDNSPILIFLFSSSVEKINKFTVFIFFSFKVPQSYPLNSSTPQFLNSSTPQFLIF